MDRSPSPPAPQPRSTVSVYADAERFMERMRLFSSQNEPTNAAAAAQGGAIVPLEPVQQHQLLLGMGTATLPGPRASSGNVLRVTLSLALSSDNPGPCVTNMAPDPTSLDEEEEEEMDEPEEVEMEDAEEVEAIREGRFYLLPPPPPPPERNAGDGEPELLILFPLAPCSSEGN